MNFTQKLLLSRTSVTVLTLFALGRCTNQLFPYPTKQRLLLTVRKRGKSENLVYRTLFFFLFFSNENGS
jgi:hypothetical protein